MAAIMAAKHKLYPDMSANAGPPPQKRPRPLIASIFIPKSSPLPPEMSYNRQLSPGGRRLVNQGRVSDNLTDPYRYERQNSYTSPRTSVSTQGGSTGSGVIPLSTQTFVNYPPSSSNSTQRYDSYSGRPVDAYSGRPRRSSISDPNRSSTSNIATLPSRTRPTVIQTDFARPASPQKGSARDKDYYVAPASSKEPRKTEHKKLYSVNDGTANLVADVDIPASGERHHKRRDSEGGERERPTYRSSNKDPERDRGRRAYHLNGPSKPKEKSIEDDDAYSYTDAAGMFRDTEPRWREREVRPRRGSVDRGGASRERPTSMLDPSYDPRRSNKEIGPPPSTRGWAKLNDGLGRAISLREKSRDIPQSPNRARVPQSPNRARAPQSPSRGRYPDTGAGAYNDQRDPYYVAPRTTSQDRHNERQNYEQYEYDERREPRRHERRNSVTRQDRPERPDRSVERRGFGIRGDSQDRYGRGSDESFERQKYGDSGYEPHRRDTAPEINYHEEQRLEREKQERLRAERVRNEERDRAVDRDGERGERRREDDRGHIRDYDRERELRRERDYDVDRERERERERMMQPPPEHERHHHRHESDREYSTKDSSRANETVAQPGLSTAAAGGLAGAAAAFGFGKALNRNDDREKERDREPDRRTERPREQIGDRLSPRPPEQRPHEAHSDEGVQYPPDRDRQRSQQQDSGLGFAFESAPEPPRSAPPIRDPAMARERVEERDLERPHEDKAPTQIPGQPAIDPDEDYRRRMEQVQRELGRGPEDRHSDSDPDRERRRREREQRQRDRFPNGDPSVAGTAASYDTSASSRMPGSFENDSVDGSTSGRPGLTRKPSILDQPMNQEQVQIIDNSMSERKENRVRIVDPPTEEEERRPKGILKKPTPKFPDHSGGMREGVAPLKDAKSSSGIPPGARWTKIDRKLVNPEALQEAKERFEERLDCVIVLRVLTKEEIQKLADRTKELRDERYEEEREERRAQRRHERHADRHQRDEYDDNSEDEFKPRAPKMLEAPSSTMTGASASDHTVSDYVRDSRDRRGERERESHHMSGGLGSRRDDGYER